MSSADNFHSLVIGLLFAIAAYPILKDREVARAEKLRLDLQEQRELREMDKAARAEKLRLDLQERRELREMVRELRREIDLRTLCASENRGLYDASESAIADNLTYLASAKQNAARWQAVIDRETPKSGKVHPANPE